MREGLRSDENIKKKMILGIDSMVKDPRSKRTVRGEDVLEKLQSHNYVRFCIKGRNITIIFINNIELNLIKFGFFYAG